MEGLTLEPGTEILETAPEESESVPEESEIVPDPEPTETESKQRLDDFINIMLKIADEVENNPEIILSAPHNTPVKKIDETLAARKPDLNFRMEE